MYPLLLHPIHGSIYHDYSLYDASNNDTIFFSAKNEINVNNH